MSRLSAVGIPILQDGEDVKAVTFNAARQMSQNGDLARYLKATLHSTMLGRAILRHYDRANR